MDKHNIHTNIMLDLECTGADLHNPCIIEIGAICFDITTGSEIARFQSPVNLDSCLAVGLGKVASSMAWLQDTIPNTLENSRSSKITLAEALGKLTNFMQINVLTTREQLKRAGHAAFTCSRSMARVWGNGAVADNVWIASAYKACGRKRPRDYIGDRCVRTLVHGFGELVGRDFAREARAKFEGTPHDALDDCRHQIRYLMAARHAVVALRRTNDVLQPSPTQSSTDPTGEKGVIGKSTLLLTEPARDTIKHSADVWDLCSSNDSSDHDDEEFYSTMPLPRNDRKISLEGSPSATPRASKVVKLLSGEAKGKEIHVSSDVTWSTNPSSDSAASEDEGDFSSTVVPLKSKGKSRPQEPSSDATLSTNPSSDSPDVAEGEEKTPKPMSRRVEGRRSKSRVDPIANDASPHNFRSSPPHGLPSSNAERRALHDIFKPQSYSTQTLPQAQWLPRSPKLTKRKPAGTLEFAIWEDLRESPKSDSSASDPKNLDRRPRTSVRPWQVPGIH